MNNYTTETFQKLTKRSSAKGHSLVQYEEDGYKSKHKKSYSEQRQAKRDWREE